MNMLNSPLFSTGLPATMVVVSSVVQDVLFEIRPDFVYSYAATSGVSATSELNLSWCSADFSPSRRWL